jgi:hypothetical protein
MESSRINEIRIALYSIFIYLKIDLDFVNILLILMAGDTAFGLMKSARMGVRFSFDTLIWGILIKCLILLIPMVLALTGKGLKLGDFTPIVNTLFRIFILSETFSILTSIYVIRAKKNIKSVDFVSMSILWVRQVLLNMATNLINSKK